MLGKFAGCWSDLREAVQRERRRWGSICSAPMSPRSSFYLAAITAVLSAICIALIDQPLARLLGEYQQPAFWDKSITMLEWTVLLPATDFASSPVTYVFFRLFSVLVLVGGMFTVMAVKRWQHHTHAWMVVAGTHVICRFLMPRIKDATGRLRPTEWLEKGGDDTFWRDGIAFPSGHVVLFASILIPLAIVAPKTRPLLAIVAFVMLARIVVNAHYLSDTLAAVTLVALVAAALAALIRRRSPR